MSVERTPDPSRDVGIRVRVLFSLELHEARPSTHILAPKGHYSEPRQSLTQELDLADLVPAAAIKYSKVL